MIFIENPTISYESYAVYVWYLVLSNAERSPDQAPFFADHDHTCLLCYSSIRNCIQRCCYLMTGISIHDDCRRRRALTRWRRLLLQLGSLSYGVYYVAIQYPNEQVLLLYLFVQGVLNMTLFTYRPTTDQFLTENFSSQQLFCTEKAVQMFLLRIFFC